MHSLSQTISMLSKLTCIQLLSKLENYLNSKMSQILRISPLYCQLNQTPWLKLSLPTNGPKIWLIFLRIKFAHKIDVPGYLEPLRLNVTITIGDLYLSAYIFTSEQPIKFYLHIKTYKFMNSYFSSWKKTEMGTIEIEIAKSPSPYVWKNLHSDVDYIPSN